MDIGKSLTYMFEDERWGVKLIIGALVIFLGFVGIVVLIGPFIAGALMVGYLVEIMRRVRAGEARPLPEWDRWGDKFVDGLKLLIAHMIWALPLFIFMLPMGLAGALSGEDGGGVLGGFAFCLSCLMFLYAVFLALATPGIYVSYSEKGTFGSALDFHRVMSITRDHLAEVVIIVIVVYIAGFLASIVGLLLCLVGLLFTVAYVYMVQGHLYGQLAAAEGPTVPVRGPTDLDAPTGWESDPSRAATGDAADDVPPDADSDLDPEQVVEDVQRRGQEALDEMDDVTVRLDQEPGEALDEEGVPSSGDHPPSG